MPPSLDVRARLILEDAFSKTFDKLNSRGREAETRFKNVGEALDASMRAGFMTPGVEKAFDAGKLKNQVEGFKEVKNAVDDAGKSVVTFGAASSKMATLERNARTLVYAFQSAGSGIRGLASGLALLQGGAAMTTFGVVGLATAAAAGALQMGRFGEVVEQQYIRFQTFIGGANEAQRALTQMGAATNGMVDDLTAMQGVTKLLSMGLANTSEQAAEMVRVALMLGQAGFTSQQKIQDWAMMLANLSVRRADNFGLSIGELRDRITELMAATPGMTRDLAFTQAAMEQASAKADRLAAKGAKAGVSADALAAAWQNLRIELSREFADPVSKLQTALARGLAFRTAQLQLFSADPALQLRGATELLVQFKRELATLQASGPPFLDPWIVKNYNGLVKNYEEQIASLEARIKDLTAATFQWGDAGVAVALKMQAATPIDPLEAYFNALAEVTNKTTALIALQEQLGALAGNIEAAGLGLPEPPKIGTALTTDAQALLKYLDALRAVKPAAADTVLQVTATLDTFQKQQTAAIAAAMGLGTNAERATALARAAFGLDASILDLVRNFDQLAPPAQDAARRLDLLALAADELRRQAAEPIKLDVAFKGLESAEGQLRTLAAGMAGVWTPGQIQQFFAQAEADLQGAWRNMGQTTQLGMDVILAITLERWRDVADAEKSTFKEREKAYTDLQSALTKTALGDIEAPKIEGALTTDTLAVWRYVAAMQAAGQWTEQQATSARTSIVALAEQQRAMLDQANALSTAEARMAAFASATLGVGKTVLDLVADFDKLVPAVRDAIDPLDMVSAAISELRRQSAAPLTPDVKIKNLEDAEKQIRSMALGMIGIWNPEQIRMFFERASRDLEDHVLNLGQIDQMGMDLLLAQEVAGWTRIVDNDKQVFSRREDAWKEANRKVEKAASDTRSNIEKALSLGLNVTEADVWATKAGTYMDKPLEAARRLAAIVASETPFKELAKHPDWVKALKIPDDVLAQGDAKLKAWAAQTEEDVKNLARPDLIDWSAFLRSWDKVTTDISAKELVLRTALDKLREAGKLAGITDEAAMKKIGEMFGVEVPEITFETYFKISGEPDTMLIGNALKGSVRTVEIPYRWILAPGEQAPMPPVAAQNVPTPPAITQIMSVTEAQRQGLLQPSAPTTTQMPLALPAPDMTQAGTQAATTFMTAFSLQLKTVSMVATLAGAWSTDIGANGVLLMMAGASLGQQVAGAFREALLANLNNIRSDIAALVAPEVAALLGSGRASGALP